MGRFDIFKEKLLKIAPDGSLKGMQIPSFHFDDMKLWQAFLEEFGMPRNMHNLYPTAPKCLYAGEITWRGINIHVLAPEKWKPNQFETPKNQPVPSTNYACGHSLTEHGRSGCLHKVDRDTIYCKCEITADKLNAQPSPTSQHEPPSDSQRCRCGHSDWYHSAQGLCHGDDGCMSFNNSTLLKPLWERPEDIPKCKLLCPQCGGVLYAQVEVPTEKLIPDTWDCRKCMMRYHFTKEEENNPELLLPQDGINRLSLEDMR